MEHKFGVSCVGSGPVICKVALDRGGYVPGESIGNYIRIKSLGSVLWTELQKWSIRSMQIHS